MWPVDHLLMFSRHEIQCLAAACRQIGTGDGSISPYKLKFPPPMFNLHRIVWWKSFGWARWTLSLSRGTLRTLQGAMSFFFVSWVIIYCKVRAKSEQKVIFCHFETTHNFFEHCKLTEKKIAQPLKWGCWNVSKRKQFFQNFGWMVEHFGKQ